DIVVNAFARTRDSLAFANALGNVFANSSIRVNGNVDVLASANNLGTHVTDATAYANLQLDARGRDLVVNHDVIVQARASSHGTGQAIGNAQANLYGGNNVFINGNVDVLASANDLGSGASSAFANANLQIEGFTGNVTVNHDVVASAHARASGSRVASANAQLNVFGNDNITVNGNVIAVVSANDLTSDATSANALTNLQIDALHGNVVVNHDVVVEAFARSSGVSTAEAEAQANIFGNVNVTINGNVLVVASANNL